MCFEGHCDSKCYHCSRVFRIHTIKPCKLIIELEEGRINENAFKLATGDPPLWYSPDHRKHYRVCDKPSSAARDCRQTGTISAKDATGLPGLSAKRVREALVVPRASAVVMERICRVYVTTIT